MAERAARPGPAAKPYRAEAPAGRKQPRPGRPLLWLRTADEVTVNEGVKGGPLWTVWAIVGPIVGADGTVEMTLELIRDPPPRRGSDGEQYWPARETLTIRRVRAFDGYWLSESGDCIRLFNIWNRELPRRRDRDVARGRER